MIVDGHVHIFTSLDGPGGYDSAETHRNYLKGSHSNVIRRRRDGAVIARPVEWARVTDFRAARFGRYEWTLDGEDYYVQQFSPSLQTMEASPEFILAQMDYVGVDVAILQHDTIYGRFNDLFAQTMRRYPGRFIGLLKIDETRAYADDQLALLHHCAADLGLRGVFFQQSSFGAPDRVEWSDAETFTPFWDSVRDLGLVVYWHQTRDYWAMTRLARRYPEITFLTHLPEGRLPREGKVHLQDNVADLMGLPNTLFEICPIAYGFQYEYPYSEMHAAIRPLYDAFGGHKFFWGSDMPNLERFCTYLQGLDFPRRHCGFIARDDLPLILGGNLARVFNLTPP